MARCRKILTQSSRQRHSGQALLHIGQALPHTGPVLRTTGWAQRRTLALRTTGWAQHKMLSLVLRKTGWEQRHTQQELLRTTALGMHRLAPMGANPTMVRSLQLRLGDRLALGRQLRRLRALLSSSFSSLFWHCKERNELQDRCTQGRPRRTTAKLESKVQKRLTESSQRTFENRRGR